MKAAIIKLQYFHAVQRYCLPGCGAHACANAIPDTVTLRAAFARLIRQLSLHLDGLTPAPLQTAPSGGCARV
jgi:hypothetical protein